MLRLLSGWSLLVARVELGDFALQLRFVDGAVAAEAVAVAAAPAVVVLSHWNNPCVRHANRSLREQAPRTVRRAPAV